MKRPAPSDITRTQFEHIRELLLSAVNPPRRRRKYDLYDTFCAVLYIMDTGCSWRTIPPEYPDWKNVRYYYDIWKTPDENGIGVVEKALRQLAEEDNGAELGCQFCGSKYRFPKDELLELIDTIQGGKV